MGRRIITTQFQSSAGRADTYSDKVVKYIPADIVGAWVAATGIISGASQKVPKDTVLWFAFGIGIVLAALWTWKQTSESGKPAAKIQIAVSTGAFVVWVFALGGPFVHLSWYDPAFGSLLLIFYTLVVGLINPPE